LRRGWTSLPWTKPNETRNVQLKPHKLREPYRLKRPSKVFVNSMSDLFHESVSDDYLHDVFDVIEDLPQHVFQILTKRAGRLPMWNRWPANVWMGVSVEDRRNLSRLGLLRGSGARVKWISFEPLLEDLGRVDLGGIDGVVVGGESGPSYRRMEMSWARSIRDHCVDAGVAFFFKQDSGRRSEQRPWIVEKDGSRTTWREFPR
jgi:protein gp37